MESLTDLVKLENIVWMTCIVFAYTIFSVFIEKKWGELMQYVLKAIVYAILSLAIYNNIKNAGDGSLDAINYFTFALSTFECSANISSFIKEYKECF